MTGPQTTTLLILALGAFVAPLISRRLGVPAVVGETLLGALIATFVGPLANTGIPNALGFLGFALLMFSAGAEIDFERIERGSKQTLVVGILFGALSMTSAVALTTALGKSPIIGVGFGVTSIALAVAALQEAGLLAGKVGQAVLIVGGLGEFVSLLALTGVNLAAHGEGQALLEQVLKLVGALLLAYVILMVLRSLVWWYPEHFERMVEARDPTEFGVRAALALMLAFVAAAAQLGLEPILGAFLAGAIFGFVFRATEPLSGKLNTVGYGFLIPFFFIGVGEELNLGSLLTPAMVSLVGQALALTVLAKVIWAPILRLVGLPWRDTLSVAFFLGAPLTLQVAVARLGEDLKLLGHDQAMALVLCSVLAGMTMPIVGRRLLGRSHEKGPATLPDRFPLSGEFG
jgi:Kef-type K+ transport system membrane component KefB